jgi:vancomycin resistance protein YoaR
MKSHSSANLSLARQIFSAIVLGCGTIIVLVLFFNLAILGLYHNRILPGVKLNGEPLGGLSIGQAAQVISTTYSFPQSGHIVLRDGEKTWIATPAQLGICLDPGASAVNAYQIGRSGSLVNRVTDMLASLFFGYSASPTFHFDEEVTVQYLTALTVEINQPVKNAGLKIEQSQVVITDGQPGRILDVASSLKSISAHLQKVEDGVIDLNVIEEQPEVLDVSQQGEQVKEILSQPLKLKLPDGQSDPVGPWKIQPIDLAKMLSFTVVKNGDISKVTVEVNRPMMIGYLQSIEEDVLLQSKNARFIFNDDTHQLELYKSAVIGRALDINNSIAAINDALLAGNHTVDLALTLTPPPVTDTATGAELGITELISAQTTYFRGSSSDRVQNIITGAEQFKGLLIAPGEEVSMAEILGDITLDNGYAEAPIILGDETIQGVGGGICQVSTTLFRTVLYSGLPITERHAHSYRVKYYEQDATGHDDSLAGMDATVFVPLVDFKFVNDTPYWLLMETWINTANYSLTWKFYSTSDGRKVNITQPVITNIVDPPDTLYVQNPELAAGEKKQVEYAAQGATVRFERTVTLNGKVIIHDVFVTTYVPWQAVIQYGPGTEGIPTPEPTPKKKQ